MINLDLEGAIFDMDGTLLDTMPYWRYTTLEYMLAHGEPVPQAMLSRMFSTSSRKLIFEYLDAKGIAYDRQAIISELEGYMNRHYLYDARVKGSAKAFLEELKRRGVRMCVATGSPREYACNGLRRLGMLDYFAYVTDNYEIPLTKNQPEYFIAQCKRLNVSPEECWVFEDALYAVQSAKAAGLKVCAIEDDTAISDRKAIRETADVYIRDYVELMM